MFGGMAYLVMSSEAKTSLIDWPAVKQKRDFYTSAGMTK